MDKLSYSSLQTFKSCKRKWYYKKIAKVTVDSDYHPSDAFNFGKAYHEILEKGGHFSYAEIDTKAICESYGQLEYYLEIMACVNAYLNLRVLQAPLRLVKAEYEIQHEKIIGYVDAILEENDKSGWWILDLKTARSIGSDLPAKLHNDAQLNLYASFAEDIAKDLMLDISKFKGCRYNVVSKPQYVPKKDEAMGDYCLRVKPKIAEFIIPVNKLSPEYFRREIEQHYALMEGIVKAEKQPNCNYSACYNYFSPCEYWSNCHGSLFTNGQGLEVIYGNR